jgi:hypothetical protein
MIKKSKYFKNNHGRKYFHRYISTVVVGIKSISQTPSQSDQSETTEPENWEAILTSWSGLLSHYPQLPQGLQFNHFCVTTELSQKDCH